MDKIPKDEETESISISRISVQAIQIHNRFYNFNPTMQRLLEEKIGRASCRERV